jgi:hypothetical protein
MSKEILILLLSSHKYPSPRNEKAQRLTWIKDAEKHGINVIHFIGGYEKRSYDKPYLRLESGDSIEEVGYKTLEAFEWSLENQKFEYIFRVNSSSYVDINNLIDFVNGVESDNLYAGHLIELKMLDLKFVSGSGIIFNKSTIQKIVLNKDLWNHSVIDDVALGQLCKQLEIAPTAGLFSEVTKNVFSYKQIDSSYHFRCKLEDHGYPRFLENINIRNLAKVNNYEFVNPFYKGISIFIFELIKLINLKFYLNKYIFRNRHLRNWLRKHKNNLLESFSN